MINIDISIKFIVFRCVHEICLELKMKEIGLKELLCNFPYIKAKDGAAKIF